MQNHPQSQAPSGVKIVKWGIVLTIVGIMVTIITGLFSGLLTPWAQGVLHLNPPVHASINMTTEFPLPTRTIPPGSFTQSGAVNLAPNSANYGYTISSWSHPAYNTYCEIPTCDPNSQRMDTLKEGQVVTATCWTVGQHVITGTLASPGYDDNRWVRLQDGTYLANTWFVRSELSPQLPAC